MTKLRNGDKPAPNPLNSNSKERVRYALVGLGNIAQVAVLPGFLNAISNSELVALVSDDPKKAKRLSRKYKVQHTYGYAQYDECLQSGGVDAVYIALPNDMHHEFTIRAAEAGVHVLCEKPLATDEIECEEMIQACERNNVKLMAAYRLHFERGNLEAIQIIKSGKIGEPRYFNSTFSMQVKQGVRTQGEKGGGTLYDVGVYCINAARYLFQADPYMAFAFSTKGHDKRFTEIDEMTAAILRFPGKKLASFTCSFGAANTATYEVIGTKGTVRVISGYEYSVPATMELKVGEKTTRRRFAKRDQFGPEIAYFSDCILKGHTPEPSGQEGLIDVHVVRSLYESACTGRAVELAHFPRHPRPSLDQEIHFPEVKPLLQIHTKSPHK
jgi:glucose-fructose oxidoreductase